MALLAAQMYTLRDHCKTAADLASACTRVKKMGYDGVQLSGVVELPGKKDGVMPESVRHHLL